MSNRQVLIATVLTVVAVAGYQYRSLEDTAELAGLRPSDAVPQLQKAPSLHFGKPAQNAIASDVWQLQPSASVLPIKLPSLKELFKPYYSLNKNGGFEAIQRSDRPTEQWQFQGVLVRDGSLRALFYNPGLRKLKNLGRGELVDDRLLIQSVGPGSVTLKVAGEKKPLSFELRILNANKETYAAKRKTL